MTMTLAPTGSALGDYEDLLGRHEAAGADHTPLGEIGNPALAAALRFFMGALSEPMAALRSFIRDSDAISIVLGGQYREIPSFAALLSPGRPFSLGSAPEVITLLEPVVDEPDTHTQRVSGTDDLLVTIRNLQTRLGITVDEVLDAAVISKSTFYSWEEKPTTRPRVSSQGRIWAMAQCVDDLEALLGTTPRAWLLADEARYDLLQEGRFDTLLELLRSQRADTFTPPVYASNYAVGPDVDEATEPVAAVRQGVSRSVQSAPGRGRRKR